MSLESVQRVPVPEIRPLVSLILPAYNEAGILEDNLAVVLDYLRTLEGEYRFEVVIVNDGSRDETAAIAEALARRHAVVRAVHHEVNKGLGQALKTGFAASRGDYVVTMDIDLSYEPAHIGAMLQKLRERHATMVLASPYMKGGRLSAVPWRRKVLSIWANRFLAWLAGAKLSTLTCLTRAYDGEFIRSLNFRSTGMESMPEIVYKGMVMRARIEQVPGHLDWTRQMAVGVKRRSSMRILSHTFATVIAGFLLRPFMFFVLPGLVLLAFSLWVNAWMLIHFFDAYAAADVGGLTGRASVAVANAYRDHPHTFIVGLLSLMLAIQLLSLGILALQSKSYFEDIFHLGSNTRAEAERRVRAGAAHRDVS
jgi:glycosyltransferase involved in cell wall biosynthesis